MFKRLMRNKKAQNTAEYAILISLVVAGIIAMQTYAQRALQARVRDAAQHMVTLTNGIGNSVQYEPYYLETDYEVSRDDVERELLDANQVRRETESNRTRAAGGSQVSTYNTTIEGIVNQEL